MSHMSELNATIREMLRMGFSPQQIARDLDIPLDWVLAVEDEHHLAPTADDYADADAIAYGDL